MQLDTTTKIVTLVSVIVGIMISVTGYITGSKLQKMEGRLKALDEIGKKMDNSSKEISNAGQNYDLSSRLIMDFQLPLAREFAENYTKETGNPNNKMEFPVPQLRNEFKINIPKWITRHGLTTGNRCEGGLKIRQVVTLVVKNIGYPDAINIKIKALKKVVNPNNPALGWQQMSNDGEPVPYYNLSTATSGWETITFAVSELRGQTKSDEDRNEAQIVLASISGESTFYGTVLIPLEITWTDEITKKPKTKRIMETQVPKLMSSLLGAEVGTACQ